MSIFLGGLFNMMTKTGFCVIASVFFTSSKDAQWNLLKIGAVLLLISSTGLYFLP